jgi:hypothetical protein
MRGGQEVAQKNLSRVNRSPNLLFQRMSLSDFLAVVKRLFFWCSKFGGTRRAQARGDGSDE